MFEYLFRTERSCVSPAGGMFEHLFRTGLSCVSPAGDVTLFDGFAFVVFFLAATEGNDEFDVAGATEELDRDDGVAGDFLPLEGGNLLFGGEEFDVWRGFGAESEIV